MTSRWTADHLKRYRPGDVGHPDIISAPQVAKLVPGLDLWDLGPARDRSGATMTVGGLWLWIGLSCPAVGDPDDRHDLATLRLLGRDDGGRWHDLGAVFPPGEAHGSRQWAGSAVVEGNHIWVTYTAAGDRTPDTPHFRQRLVEAEGIITVDENAVVLADWSSHAELFAPDTTRYDPADDHDGKPGFIKAFRDPFPFRDPMTGADHVLFTASMPEARSATDFNGAIGIARATASGWDVLDPLVTADGVNNELERPHIVVHDRRYYLFFSTQARTFHPDVRGPTGLYGFVANHLLGDYQPLNGHGLVFTNPPEEPRQAYSWMVLDDLSVFGFIDAHSLAGSHHDAAHQSAATRRAHFGGTLAPPLQLGLDIDRAWLVT